MVISISGRKGSGKSELAKVCEENGFTILHFADSLKNLVCILLKCDRAHLETIKENDINIYLTNEDIEIIANEIDIPVKSIEFIKDILFVKPRNLLQFIGTNIIRKFNENWHILKLKEKIENGKNYCIDDTRFGNEKIFIENELNGICWYIIRTGNFEISNHESEISLKWVDFDINNVLVNKMTKNIFIKKWRQYLISLLNPRLDKHIFGFNNKMALRKFLAHELLSKTTFQIADENQCSRDKIVWWCDRLMLEINRESYLFNKEAFLYPSELYSYVAGLISCDGCIKPARHNKMVSFTSTDLELVEIVKDSLDTNKPIYIRKRELPYKDSYDIDCNNPFIVENIKHWNIKPRKSGNKEVPDIIKNDVNFLKQWIVGLIDGDGSIYCTKTGNLGISMLSSRNVLEFINSISPVRANIYKHKRILFQWTINNYNAVIFYKWLNPKFGLNRKWNKINEFIAMNKKSKKYSKEEIEKILQ